jgi:osmotically-inducible protein OsmY
MIGAARERVRRSDHNQKEQAMTVKKIAQRSMMGAGLTVIVLGMTVLPICTQAQDQSASDANQRMTPAAASDTAARVRSALKSNPTFDGRHVAVSMDKDNVVLSGFVQSSQALQAATRIATKAAGDHKIVNRLSINQNYPNAP